jgi:hypothetical protein
VKDERYIDWQRRIASRLPDAAARTFALRGVAYYGSGFHYGLEHALGKVISIASTRNGDRQETADAIASRIIDEVIVEGFFRDLAKAERSAAATRPNPRKERSAVSESEG